MSAGRDVCIRTLDDFPAEARTDRSTCERYGFGLAQYTAEGALDTTFADAGLAFPDFVTSSGAYGAALLLDGWAMLSRPDLRVAEETLRRWMGAAALVVPAADGGRLGRVVVEIGRASCRERV